MNSIKKMILLFCVSASSGMSALVKADSLGLPGDNFDLYGALELFKKSNSPEEFEKAINSNNNEINNLDLNADGKVDYVKVIDKSKDDSHSLVMQVDISKTETQDVGVIEVEKTKDGNAHLQVVGDEELYGKNYIIEPKDENAAKTSPQPAAKTSDANDDDVYATSTNNNSSNNNNSGSNYNTYYDPGPAVNVNVWGWPSVQYMYGPSYSVWASPWYWGYYPGWWSPWYPVYWPVYYRRMYQYHYPYYHRTNFYTCHVAHNYYYGRRSTSTTVVQYNRTGVYAQKQMAYKQNVQPGRKYNALPANEEKQQEISKREANEPKPMNTENKEIGMQKNNQSQKANEQQGEFKSQPKQMTKEQGQFNKQQTEQPKQMEQPKQVNNEPKQFNSEPKEINAQPKQVNTQPVEKVEKQQPVRVQKSQPNSFPQNRSMGGGGGGMRGGGGGRRR